MSSTLADYRERLRILLQIQTPRAAWLQRQTGSVGSSAGLWDVDGPVVMDDAFADTNAPPIGANPVWQQQPSNYALDSVIRAAAYKVTRLCRVRNAWTWSDINIPAQTASGPYIVHLDTLPGFPENGVTSVKRAYWFDGQTYTPLRPVLLSRMDIDYSNYLNDGPATPYRYAIEGNLLYLLPGTPTDGVLRLTVGSGALAPLCDTEGYGLPIAYDDCINYNALQEIADIMPSDTEMINRGKSFADNAAEGILSLTAYFDNIMMDEFSGNAAYRTQVIRVNRRN